MTCAEGACGEATAKTLECKLDIQESVGSRTVAYLEFYKEQGKLIVPLTLGG
jgi:hypothetical protein